MDKAKKKAVGRQTEPESLSEELSTNSTCTQRPKTSPYTSAPVRIYIGSGHEYYVPRHLLQNPKWIASCSGPLKMYQPNVNLLDVDENTGHVLVHYLYTGAYQTLDNMKTSSAKEVNIEFKRAFLVYAMAKTYELASLQQLAMHKIEHHSMKMNIFDVFEALNEDFSKLQDKSDWFQDYLNEKIKVAFEEDYTTFAKNDLFDRISNDALNKFVVQHVIELYNSKVSCMLNTEKEAIQEFSDEYVPAAQYSPVEEASAKVSVAIEEAPVADCSIHEGPTQECSVQECSIGDPPVEEAPVQGPFIDETVAADAVNAVSIERAPVTDENPPGGEEWAVLGNKAKKKKKKDVAAIIDESIPEPAPEHEKPDEKDLWSFSFGNAKNKENEKNGAVLIEDTFVNPEPACEPVLEPEPEATKEADFWRFEPFSTGKKTKKDKKGAIGESAAVVEDTSAKPELGSEPVIEPEPEAAKEDAVWGFSSFSASKKKKGKKNATKVVEDKPNMEELAPPPLEPAPLADDGWGTSMMPDKKKKGKKSAKQKALVTKPSSSHSELELGTEHESEKKDKLWVDWGTTATWKKKGSKDKKEPKAIVALAGGGLDDGPRKMKAISESNISTASPYVEQVENGTLWAFKQNEQVETRVSNGRSDFQAESEQPVKIEDGICPVRAKHLLEGDKWKTCRQCRAVLRQVAIQLASMGHADENEYEMVDHILTE